MKILLVCNAGMSTGIMQMKLEEEAKKEAVDVVIEAIPISEIEENLEHCNCILLGPQVRFAEDDIKQIVHNDIPVLSISLQDFGLMQADHVWAQVKEQMK